ncbi:ANKF1 protein, partial [Atractosteus spatula]|nr:ANKF1 protein [Atractosteus spatula]
MALPAREPPLRRRSLGPVSPKRIYRNLSVRLRGGETSQGDQSQSSGRHNKDTPLYPSLWEAVENEDTLAVQEMLSQQREVNALSPQGLVPLDVAALTLSTPLLRILIRAGARENPLLCSPADWSVKLQALVRTAGRCVAELKDAVCTGPPEAQQDTQKQLRVWTLRYQLYCRMRENFARTVLPGPPSNVSLLVSSATSLTVSFREPEGTVTGLITHYRVWVYSRVSVDVLIHSPVWVYSRVSVDVLIHSPVWVYSRVSVDVLIHSPVWVYSRVSVDGTNTQIAPVTQCCVSVFFGTVEWSSSATFDPLCGSVLVHDTKNLHFIITGLTTGGLYFVRVSAYNVKGYGPAQSSSPPSAAPSSWTQCCGVKQRSREQATGVRKLLEQIQDPQYRGYFIDTHTHTHSHTVPLPAETSRVHTPSKKLSVSRSLKHLFQSATKFVRSLQRGVYLAAVFYHKDNILVTAEEQIPLVEIHSCSTSVTQDFLWFAKLSCAWKDVSWLQQAMTSSLSSSSSLLQTRQKILLAVSQLQSSLGTVDLGQVYHEPIKDRQGNVLLVTLREGSSLSPPDPLRWTPLARFQRERQRSHLLPDPTAIDTLTEHLKEKLCYHRRSVQTAQPGLYVGVLKLCSSVDQIRVLVPHKLPNLLYHARVRHNPHVSREEWAWLQGLCGRGAAEGRGPPDPGLGEFVRSLRAAVSHLLTKLNIPLHKAQCYRLYTQEVLQLGQQVSFLLLLPPSEDFCASPGKDGALSGFLTLPLQIFELVHFSAYEQEFFSQYCQASLLLELDAQLSQQALREALDRREVQEAKDRLDQVLQLTQVCLFMQRFPRHSPRLGGTTPS